MRTALSRVPVRISARRPVVEPVPMGDLVFWGAAEGRDWLGINHHNRPAAANPSHPRNVALARQPMTVSNRPTSPGTRVLPISPEKLYWDSACLIPPPSS